MKKMKVAKRTTVRVKARVVASHKYDSSGTEDVEHGPPQKVEKAVSRRTSGSRSGVRISKSSSKGASRAPRVQKSSHAVVKKSRGSTRASRKFHGTKGRKKASKQEDTTVADHVSKEKEDPVDVAGKLALKRVKMFNAKVRPLPVDEKMMVFMADKDDDISIHKFDNGEFWRWLQDCESGKADPLEAGPYPLVIQDSDLRHVLEIKYPSERALRQMNFNQIGGNSSNSTKAKKNKRKQGDVDQGDEPSHGIKVPGWKKLGSREWPENALIDEKIPIVVRNPGGDAESCHPSHMSTNLNQDHSANEQAYMRYMQPTPDDLDQAIEYDLDEEDETWLEKYNGSKSAHSKLKEEWMEHLMDRMEKEYTLELQKHPEKWITAKKEESNDLNTLGENIASQKGLAGTLPPPVILPSIPEIFPLSKCLKVRGLSAEERVVKDVYNYWKKKHQKSGRPLIQRLWYEPPWHRKATDVTAAKAAEGEDVFSGYDVPSTLSRIRKRKMNSAEVQSRFDCIRRDLEMVRTIADLVRRREKLKKQEATLMNLEWASRMQDVASGKLLSMTRGNLKSRPPKLSSVSGSRGIAPVHGGVRPISAGKASVDRKVREDRAARLAARRDVRAEALANRQSDSGRSKKMNSSRTRSSKGSPSKRRRFQSSTPAQPRSSSGKFLSFSESKRSHQP